MNEQIIKNWNKHVTPQDDVYHLGDLSFAPIEKTIQVLQRLNYKRLHLINGNHDHEIIKHSEQLLSLYKTEHTKLVEEITPYKEININGQFIVLFHYSTRVWNKSHRGSWALWGHSHGSLSPHGKSVDVGVDAPFVLNGERPYRPLSYLEIKKFMDKQVPEDVDHHRNRE